MLTVSIAEHSKQPFQRSLELYSVTSLGDILDFGQLFKAFGDN